MLFQKEEDLCKLVENELNIHVKSNILPKMRCVEEENFLPALADSWTRFKEAVFSSNFTLFFSHLNRWAGGDSSDGIPVGIKAYRTEFLFDADILDTFRKSLAELMGNPDAPHEFMINKLTFSDFTLSFLETVRDMLEHLSYDKDPTLMFFKNQICQLLDVN